MNEYNGNIPLPWLVNIAPLSEEFLDWVCVFGMECTSGGSEQEAGPECLPSFL